jgi:DNA polymerase
MADTDIKAQWKSFEDSCRNCRACGLASTRTNVVISRGAKNAPLMLIGEAPGHDEDIKGLPFVGRSGQLLQNLLAAYGFREKDYHICNIVKCRPPENRRPEPSEIAACKKLLAQQFALVKPKVIVLLGSTAYEAFYGDKPVMRDVRGAFTERKGDYIMTTFHPAFALRNEKMKIPIYEDMGKVRAKLEELGLIEALDK